MRDKLEGRRPSDMPGVSLAKGRTVAVAAGPGRGAWPVIAALVVLLICALFWMLADRDAKDPAATTPASTGPRTDGAVVVMRRAPGRVYEETYETSVMEKVVLAEYRPSTDDGEDSVNGRAHLIGRGGIDMQTILPHDCQNAPIEARVGRLILIRADVWRLKDGGQEKSLSDDDAKAALCGDFKGRDVKREQPSDRSPRQSEDPNVIEEK